MAPRKRGGGFHYSWRGHHSRDGAGDGAEGWHLHLTSADRNKTLKCYLVSLQKCRGAKLSSFSDVVPYRVSLRELSRVWPYCSPWSSYGLPTQTPNCFVDVKYCTLPREPWSQLEPGAVVETDSYIVFLNSETAESKTQMDPDRMSWPLRKSLIGYGVKLAFISLYNPLHLS